MATLDDVQRAMIAGLDGIEVRAGIAGLAGAGDRWRDHPLLDRLAAGGMQPPDVTDVPRNDVRELVRRGFVVERDGICFHPDAVAAAASCAAELLAAQPGRVHHVTVPRRRRHHPQVRHPAADRARRPRHHPTAGGPAAAGSGVCVQGDDRAAT